MAAGRLADVLAAVELLGRRLPLERRDRALSDRLRIVYLVARTGWSDGERLLLAQATQLAALGAEVTVLTRGHLDDVDRDLKEHRAKHRTPEHRVAERRAGARARLRRVPYGESITDAVPPCDLVVAGSWEFVLPARMLALAPVVLCERGALHALGDVPEHIRAVVEASLRAAVTVFALGATARAALESSYGVDCCELPATVDLAVFHPGPRRAAVGQRSRDVLLVGSDDGRAGQIEAARHVVAGLRTLRPGLTTTWVGPQPSTSEAPWEVVPAPSESARADLYRSGRVFVSTSAHELAAVTPLEMMASGTPVVAWSHPGATGYLSDGKNALLVPDGDVDGLVAAALAVLDDDVLAARLVAAGRRTAALRSSGAFAPQLLESYARVVRGARIAPPLGDFAVTLGGLRFARPSHAAQLRARLGSCTTRSVALPVSQPGIGSWRVVRWRVVARRDEGEVGVTRVYLPARSEHPLDDAPAQDCLDLLRAGEPERALDGLIERCEHATRDEQAVLGRWLVLAMLAALRPDDAFDLARAFAKDFPTHPDYLVLAVVAARAAKRPVELAGPLEAVALLGAGARHDEWFEDPAGLLAAALAGEVEAVGIGTGRSAAGRGPGGVAGRGVTRRGPNLRAVSSPHVGGAEQAGAPEP